MRLRTALKDLLKAALKIEYSPMFETFITRKEEVHCLSDEQDVHGISLVDLSHERMRLWVKSIAVDDPRGPFACQHIHYVKRVVLIEAQDLAFSINPCRELNYVSRNISYWEDLNCPSLWWYARVFWPLILRVLSTLLLCKALTQNLFLQTWWLNLVFVELAIWGRRLWATFPLWRGPTNSVTHDLKRVRDRI
jgi:hypothetical protein